MLYVTTRDNRDAFTVNRVLYENRGPDGGQYVPFHHPRFSPEEMDALLQKSSGECIAEILNLLFGTRLNGWDVDFCIGRQAIRLHPLQNRILLAECWHTPGYRFDRIVSKLTEKITQKREEPSDWMQIGIRAAVLFGVFSQLRVLEIREADISCLSGDFLMPVSAWYAKHWGLPVRNIVCCCNENNVLWELLCHGQMRTDLVSVPTFLPDADVALPVHLERMIYECGGTAETGKYLEACRRGRSYCAPEAVHAMLKKELYASVVSSQRIRDTIPGIYRTHGRLLSCDGALSCAGLLDHRSRTGTAGYAVIWSERSPITEAEIIGEILGIPGDTVEELI